VDGELAGAEVLGTSVYWNGPKQPNYGKADVYLDGVYQTTVSQYAPVASAKIRDFIWGVGGSPTGSTRCASGSPAPKTRLPAARSWSSTT